MDQRFAQDSELIMARATAELITALRTTADRLAGGAHYRWSHQGACNCGHLAQTVTNLSRAEIHKRALQKAGDWNRHTVDYCPTSGYPIDHIISAMLEIGLTPEDLAHLERLSDRNILRRLPPGQRELDHRKREDVIRYMRTFATMLEETFLAQTPAPEFTAATERAGPRRLETTTHNAAAAHAAA